MDYDELVALVEQYSDKADRARASFKTARENDDLGASFVAIGEFDVAFNRHEQAKKELKTATAAKKRKEAAKKRKEAGDRAVDLLVNGSSPCTADFLPHERRETLTWDEAAGDFLHCAEVL